MSMKFKNWTPETLKEWVEGLPSSPLLNPPGQVREVRMDAEGEPPEGGQGEGEDGGAPMYELKPCPFCGGEAKAVKRIGCYPNNYVVVCQTEGCEASLGNYSATKADAIAAWNQREGRE